MKPTIGRIVHVMDKNTDQCQAAIVTGKIREFQATPEDDIIYGFNCTIFPCDGPKDTAARMSRVYSDTDWHYANKCPYEPYQYDPTAMDAAKP